jgi:membrane-associated protein
MDQIHPAAMSAMKTQEPTLNARCPRGERCQCFRGGGGSRASSSSMVDPESSKVELASLLSAIPPHICFMDQLRELFANLQDLPALIKWAGYFGLTAIVFAETGLLIGFFLPGDSLLVTAGLVSARGMLNVYFLGLLLNIAAAAGNSFGYLIGRMTGPRIFTREDSLFFSKKNVYRAQDFYARHGRKAIVLAQFMPIIRTFSPVVAGVGQMPYRQFLVISVLGTILWVWSMLFTGHFLGTYIPGIDKHIEVLVLTVIFVSVLPALISWWREKRKTAAAAAN